MQNKVNKHNYDTPEMLCFYITDTITKELQNLQLNYSSKNSHYYAYTKF